jgi:acetylornithine deacetylase
MVEFDDGLAQTIRGAVHARREDAVSLLRELVRVPSVTGAVGAVVGRAFSERGLDVDTWEATREETEPYRDHVGEQISYENRPNVAGTRRGTGDGRSILLNAHTDTVDPGDPTAWRWDPLSGNLEGDLLYGRGSCDMKGGLVTHLVALDVLSDLGIGLRGDVTVAATVGEENGGLGALQAARPTPPSATRASRRWRSSSPSSRTCASWKRSATVSSATRSTTE